MAEPVDVAVICVTHNSDALLPGVFRSLQIIASECAMRVVFVDSGSRDGTVETLRGFTHASDVRILDANYGFSAGINAGIARVVESGGAFAYLIMNPDVRIDANTVPLLLEALRVPGVGIAVPRIVDENGDILPSLRNRPSVTRSWCDAVLGGPLSSRLGLPSEVIRTRDAYTGDREACWATGGMLLISADCARAVGEWDPSFFMYEEEVDYALRAADAGYKLRFVAEASALRIIGERRAAPWAEALMHRNRVALLARREPAYIARLHEAGLIFGTSLRAVAGRANARAALWALVHRASPLEVLARYRPDARAQIKEITSPP